MPMVETLAADVHPPYLYADYKSTRLRAPASPLVRVAPSPLEAAGPSFPRQFVKDSEADLTTWGRSAPLGEKMVLVGRVLDEDGRPVDRKSTRLNSSHLGISYAVFCLNKKGKSNHTPV